MSQNRFCYLHYVVARFSQIQAYLLKFPTLKLKWTQHQTAQDCRTDLPEFPTVAALCRSLAQQFAHVRIYKINKQSHTLAYCPTHQYQYNKLITYTDNLIFRNESRILQCLSLWGRWLTGLQISAYKSKRFIFRKLAHLLQVTLTRLAGLIKNQK